MTTAATPGTLVQISPERERNGYDDSDFYVSVIDLETGKVDHNHMVGSTRFGGGCRYDDIRKPSELSDVERAAFEGALWGHAMAMALSVETNRIMHPQPWFAEWVPQPGTRVALKEAVRNRNKVEQTCLKCSGSGKWVNPRNKADVRQCLGCSGKGTRLGHAKGAGMREIPAGTTGTVVDAGERRSQYGTWSQGASAVIRTDDGQTFRANTRALRLAEEPNLLRARLEAERMFEAATSWTCPTTGRTAA